MLAKIERRFHVRGAGFLSILIMAALWILFGSSVRRRVPAGLPRPLAVNGGTRNAVESSNLVHVWAADPLPQEQDRHMLSPYPNEPLDEGIAPKVEETKSPGQYGWDEGEGRPWNDAGEVAPAQPTVLMLEGPETDPEVPAVQAKPSRNLRPLLVEIFQTILLTLIIFAGVRSLVQNFKVDGASMEPTLHTGQYLLINKVAYSKLEGLTLNFAQQTGIAPRDAISYYPFGGPQRGDIAVFQYPGGPERDFIKRVIALPGDLVQIERGKVYVNGVMLDESYIRAVPSYSVAAQKVPEGQYFVLGDNRPNSSDSHIWGYVPEGNMIGKAWVSYWPPSDWGAVTNVGIAAN